MEYRFLGGYARGSGPGIHREHWNLLHLRRLKIITVFLGISHVSRVVLGL